MSVPGNSVWITRFPIKEFQITDVTRRAKASHKEWMNTSKSNIYSLMLIIHKINDIIIVDQLYRDRQVSGPGWVTALNFFLCFCISYHDTS